MINEINVTNLFNNTSVNLYASGYEVNFFAWKPIVSGEDNKRGQSVGRFKNFKSVEYLSIILRGAILGNSTSDFWTKRDNLMTAILPDPDSTERDHVRLTFTRDDGGPTDFYADCVIEDFDAPLEALFPTVDTFDFTFESRDGYWRRASSGALVTI